MANEIKLPNITSITPMGQLAQLQSYLYQLVQQLNYLFSSSSVTGIEKTKEYEKLTPDDLVSLRASVNRLSNELQELKETVNKLQSQ